MSNQNGGGRLALNSDKSVSVMVGGSSDFCRTKSRIFGSDTAACNTTSTKVDRSSPTTILLNQLAFRSPRTLDKFSSAPPFFNSSSFLDFFAGVGVNSCKWSSLVFRFNILALALPLEWLCFNIRALPGEKLPDSLSLIKLPSKMSRMGDLIQNQDFGRFKNNLNLNFDLGEEQFEF